MVAIQICSKEEWKAAKDLINPVEIKSYPYGEYFKIKIEYQDCIFYFSGETKTLSAGACQFAIDQWSPKIVIVLGTCGGVSKDLQLLDIIMAEKTAQYDVIPMKKKASLFHEIIYLNNSWINFDECPLPILRGFIATADQSVTASNYHNLRKENVIAADWETAAIAKICSINRVRYCVVRGVSDLPSEEEKNDQYTDYLQNTSIIMEKLITSYLPSLITLHNDDLESNQSSAV
jgi:adenosylhomocysteine nucleosidase